MIGVTDLGRKLSENKVFGSKVSISFYGTVFHELVHAEEFSLLRNDSESDEFLRQNVDDMFEKINEKWKFIGDRRVVSHYSTSGPEYLAELGATFFLKRL